MYSNTHPENRLVSIFEGIGRRRGTGGEGERGGGEREEDGNVLFAYKTKNQTTNMTLVVILFGHIREDHHHVYIIH